MEQKRALRDLYESTAASKDDLTLLEKIEDASISNHLSSRSESGELYTNIGDVSSACNSFSTSVSQSVSQFLT